MQSKQLYALSLRMEELIKWFWKMLTTVFDKQSGALCVGRVGDGCVCIDARMYALVCSVGFSF